MTDKKKKKHPAPVDTVKLKKDIKLKPTASKQATLDSARRGIITATPDKRKKSDMAEELASIKRRLAKPRP